MNKKALIAVVVLILLLAGGYGAYRVYKHFKRLATPVTGTAMGTPVPNTLASLKDLIAKGVAQTCTYSSDKTQGSVYMDAGKVRVDVNTQVDDKPLASHIIIADNTSYIWMDGKNTGFKMAYNPASSPVPSGETQSAGSSGMLDPNMNLNYKCGVWIGDASKFALPANVTFSSFSLPQAAPAAPAGASSNSSQCSYCNNLTGDSKAQCLAALKCN